MQKTLRKPTRNIIKASSKSKKMKRDTKKNWKKLKMKRKKKKQLKFKEWETKLKKNIMKVKPKREQLLLTLNKIESKQQGSRSWEIGNLNKDEKWLMDQCVQVNPWLNAKMLQPLNQFLNRKKLANFELGWF